LPAVDDERDIELLVRQVADLLFQRRACGSPGGIRKNRLVYRQRSVNSLIHSGLRKQASRAVGMRAKNPVEIV